MIKKIIIIFCSSISLLSMSSDQTDILLKTTYFETGRAKMLCRTSINLIEDYILNFDETDLPTLNRMNQKVSIHDSNTLKKLHEIQKKEYKKTE